MRSYGSNTNMRTDVATSLQAARQTEAAQQAEVALQAEIAQQVAEDEAAERAELAHQVAEEEAAQQAEAEINSGVIEIGRGNGALHQQAYLDSLSEEDLLEHEPTLNIPNIGSHNLRSHNLRNLSSVVEEEFILIIEEDYSPQGDVRRRQFSSHWQSYQGELIDVRVGGLSATARPQVVKLPKMLFMILVMSYLIYLAWPAVMVLWSTPLFQ